MGQKRKVLEPVVIYDFMAPISIASTGSRASSRRHEAQTSGNGEGWDELVYQALALDEEHGPLRTPGRGDVVTQEQLSAR